MSTTPRTDAARGFHDMDTAVSAEDMAQLETELAAMQSEFEKVTLLAAQTADRNVELRFRAEKAEADTARLDWLSVSDVWLDIPATEVFTPETMRDAIDAAMKKEVIK